MVKCGCAMIGGLVFFAALTAAGLSSQQIFEQTEPSVALIGNEEGFASGVIISKDGKILTNYHAILSPLPLTVRAKVLVGGEWTEMVFTDISVVGVHKSYDLALLQVKGNRRPLKPIVLSSLGKKRAGAECFVIGNPGAGREALRNTITSGLISSMDRVMEDGLSYIQISAAINPGNSGGALLDDDGRLTGIVTFKPVDTEGIGFAIPVQDNLLKSFVEPKQKGVDSAKGQEFEKKGSQLYDRAIQTNIPDVRKLMLEMANYYYRMSLTEMPTSFVPYHNVGMTYRCLGDAKLAKAYLEKALSMNSDNAQTLHVLGIVYLEEGRKEDAQKLWLKGAFLKGAGGATCAMNASITCMENKDWVSAAYLAQLSLVDDPDYMGGQKREMLRQAQGEVSDQVRQLLASKKSAVDFSAQEMQQLKAVETKALAEETKVLQAQQVQLNASRAAFEKRVAELLKRPDTMEDRWVQKKVPRPVVSAVPAFGGMAVALAFKELGKIGILDVRNASVEKYLTTGGNEFVMAAGGSRIVVFLKGLGVLETYDLNTMARIGEKKLPASVIITAMEMGLNNADAVFVSYAENTDALSTRYYALLDPLSGRITPLKSTAHEFVTDRPNRFWHSCYRDQVRFSTDANLNHLTCWCTGQSPAGFEYVTVDLAKALFDNRYQHSDFGDLGLSEDGSYVFSSTGYIFKDGAEMKRFAGSSLYPVLSGNFFLEIKDKKQATVRAVPSMAEIMKVELPVELKTDMWSAGSLPSNRRLIASALSQRLVVIDADQAMVYVHPMKVRASVGGTGEPGVIVNSLFAIPGSTWVYDLQLATGDQAKIADAPPGMALAGGQLRWQVPQKTEKKAYEILVSIKSANNTEDYRVVKLLVQ